MVAISTSLLSPSSHHSTMLTSQFTQEQNDLIKSYMADFKAMTLQVNPDFEYKPTTRY